MYKLDHNQIVSYTFCVFFSLLSPLFYFFFFFNDTATTEIYTLSLHDALPISERSWIGSFFFVGIKKCPSFLRSFLVDSHQRFHSTSVKTSPISHSAICGTVALPPALSRIFRTLAARASLASFLTASKSLALRARKCSGGMAARFSAAYCNCIGCAFLPAKSMMIWLRSRFHSETRPKPQLLCRQKVPGLSLSSCSAAFAVSFPDSTSFCSSASIQGSHKLR